MHARIHGAYYVTTLIWWGSFIPSRSPAANDFSAFSTASGFKNGASRECHRRRRRCSANPRGRRRAPSSLLFPSFLPSFLFFSPVGYGPKQANVWLGRQATEKSRLQRTKGRTNEQLKQFDRANCSPGRERGRKS